MEDHWARDFLLRDANENGSDVSFEDYPVRESFDPDWRARCQTKISRTNGTIVMIGPTTASSEAVLWEIAETVRQGKSLLGVQIHKGKAHEVPVGIPASSVIQWDFRKIARTLAMWTSR